MDKRQSGTAGRRRKISSTHLAAIEPATTPATIDDRVATATKDAQLVNDRREQLLDAAIEVFSRKGYYGATVRDIGRSARMTQGTIYNYVKSKDDILFLVCDRLLKNYMARVRSAYISEGTASARLRAAVQAATIAGIEDAAAVELVFNERHCLAPRYRKMITELVDGLLREFQEFLAAALEDDARRGSIRLRAHMTTFVPVMFALRGWGMMPSDMSKQEMLEEVVNFIMAGLGFPPVKKGSPSNRTNSKTHRNRAPRKE